MTSFSIIFRIVFSALVGEIVVGLYEIVSLTECPQQLKEYSVFHDRINHIPYPITFQCSHLPFERYLTIRKAPIHESAPSHSCEDLKSAVTAEAFLNLLRNKTLGFFGDSLTRQLFHATIAINLPYQTTFTPHTYKKKNIGSSYYEQFNATILFAEDGFGKNFQDEEDFLKYFHPLVVRSDFLVVGLAAWYKPFFRIPGEKIPDFHQNAKASLFLFENQLTRLREAIRRIEENDRKKRQRIIWRTSPHAGCVLEKELQWLLKNGSYSSSSAVPYDLLTRAVHFPHRDGALWTSLASKENHTASWAMAYNEVIRRLQRDYSHWGDVLLDWFPFSLLYLRSLAGHISVVHVDSLHYCVDGLPMASTLLLFDTLADLVSQR